MYKVFDKEKLEKIIADHAHWLAKDCDGYEAMRADLRNADLRGVDLHEKDLRGAMLDGAIMDKHTCLVNADLSGSFMSGAYLSGTDLRHAILNKVDADNTVFSQIVVDDDTDFTGTDLSHAEFSVSEKVMHATPLYATLISFIFVGIILIIFVIFADIPDNILSAVMLLLSYVGIFALILTYRLCVPAMCHAIELTDVSRYMKIAGDKEIGIDELAVLISLFKGPPKNGKDCRQMVVNEIRYYTNMGYFPNDCYDAEKRTVCFCRTKQDKDTESWGIEELEFGFPCL